MSKRETEADIETSEMSGDLVLLGRISAAHGVRGEVKINSFTDVPEDIAAYGPLKDGAGRRFFIRQARAHKGMSVTAVIDGVTDRNAAEALKGVALYVAREMLPEADEDEWYHADLIGLAVFSPEGEGLGEIIAVQNFGAGDLLEIKPPAESRTVLIPFTKAAVPIVDVKAARVIVDPPRDLDEDEADAGDEPG